MALTATSNSPPLGHTSAGMGTLAVQYVHAHLIVGSARDSGVINANLCRMRGAVAFLCRKLCRQQTSQILKASLQVSLTEQDIAEQDIAVFKYLERNKTLRNFSMDWLYVGHSRPVHLLLVPLPQLGNLPSLASVVCDVHSHNSPAQPHSEDQSPSD